MATSTPNYALVKPTEATDFVDVDQLNANMDTLDTELKAVSDVANSAAVGVTFVKTLGGIRRTTNDGNTSGTTEKVGITAPSLALEASKTYLITFYCVYGGDTNDDLFNFRIRQDSVSGTVVGGDIGSTKVVTTGGTPSLVVQGIYITTGAESKVFVGTIRRVVGTGVGNVRIASYMTVSRLGSDTVLSTV